MNKKTKNSDTYQNIFSIEINFHDSAMNDTCNELHYIFNRLQRYHAWEIGNIPFMNGIYIVFEKGELYGDFDRIVRIGTHRGPNRLKRRLRDHFCRKSKDRSIFRKNIGRAMLNQIRDPYLTIWTRHTFSPLNAHLIDCEKQKYIENQVSDYLNKNVCFTAFPVDNKEQRLRLESAIISSLHHATDFKASDTWFGNMSTEEKIRDSSMWVSQGLDAETLTSDELQFIKEQTFDVNIK